ncbi:alpha-ketoglutarate-dependent dioxygenase alkB homolog 4-like isoform X2 [Lineus longissimus]|uniref:alpha-ketoglutarate-dependent dioxygenase alkB homolog 4-like isoform X2 n=1 Tax=Lineus longissimus TaxID=88925 RepID=UPI00315CD9A1
MGMETYIYCQDCEKAWSDLNTLSSHPEHSGQSINFPGILIMNNFITEEEEQKLVQEIDEIPWVDSQSGRRKQDFGPKVNFKKKKLKLQVFSGLAPFSRLLIDSIKQIEKLKDFIPVEQCQLEYVPERGSAIDPHFDDFWLWGEHLVTLNLVSGTYLSMTHDDKPGVLVLVPMDRRSLITVFGPSRYEWKHGIRREDIRERRLAITFREFTPEFLPGGKQEELGEKVIQTALTFEGISVASYEHGLNVS